MGKKRAKNFTRKRMIMKLVQPHKKITSTKEKQPWQQTISNWTEQLVEGACRAHVHGRQCGTSSTIRY